MNQLVPLPRAFSLAKREADIAVTIDRPVEGRLTVKKLTDYSLSLFASKSFLEAHPALAEGDLAGVRVVAYVPDLIFSPALDYLDEFGLSENPKFECAGMLGQIEAVRLAQESARCMIMPCATCPTSCALRPKDA